jgi:hypothetical protein
MALRDYQSHHVSVFAIDTHSAGHVLLAGSPKTFACHPPTGHLDRIDCKGFAGWVHDSDTPAESIEVRIAFDNETFDQAQIVVTATKARQDLCTSVGCNHGFDEPMPVFMRNSESHSVTVFAKDTQAGRPVPIAESPNAFRCDPPPLPASPPLGVLRPVSSMNVFHAWKFSMLWDVAQYADKALVDYTVQDSIPTKPQLARAEGANAI